MGEGGDNMKILILEDDSTRWKEFMQNLIGHNVTIVAQSKIAIEKLEKEDWDVCYFDHDLGGEVFVESGENTGYETAKWLEEHPDRQPKHIILHSFNPVGLENMHNALPNAIKHPGAWTKKLEEII